MEKDLGSYRKSYDKSELLEGTVPESPIALFQTWFEEVEKADGVIEPNAMTVASIGLDGFPKSRVVLLKKYNHEGFVFYTNYTSEKGMAIAKNPNVCISFFWPNLERQVIIKGMADKLISKESDNYFQSRPKGSQLGALVSDQSSVIASREVLESKLKDLQKEYKEQSVKRPDHWGGYLVKPISIEFWQGRPNRLHDRILYSLNADFNWTIERLAP